MSHYKHVSLEIVLFFFFKRLTYPIRVFFRIYFVGRTGWSDCRVYISFCRVFTPKARSFCRGGSWGRLDCSYKRLSQALPWNFTDDRNGGLTNRNGGLTRRNAGLTRRNGGLTRRNGGLKRRNDGFTRRNAGLTNRHGDWTRRNGGLTRRIVVYPVEMVV